MTNRIGFMQGRLSPIINGKIQEFPWNNWREEFEIGASLGFTMMEWTLDQERLSENPLMTLAGQREIVSMFKKYSFSVPSLTGDCFMQAPFWKVNDSEQREKLKVNFKAIADSCHKIGIKFIVVPLVDGGSLENEYQENSLVQFLLEQESQFIELGIRVIFESDFQPLELKRFISRLPSEVFGINYDIGNSASMGLNPFEEFEAFGDRILNVHVKDRVLDGSTVPLGEGSSEFIQIFSLLASIKYSGNYILQTARAQNGNHAAVLANYKAMVEKWVLHSGS